MIDYSQISIKELQEQLARKFDALVIAGIDRKTGGHRIFLSGNPLACIGLSKVAQQEIARSLLTEGTLDNQAPKKEE